MNDVRNCFECQKQLTCKQKKYCSRRCQSSGNSKLSTKIDEIECTCNNCNKLFKRKPYKMLKKTNLLVYCSRSCKDLHQKIIYRNKGNPCHGKKWSEAARKKHLEAITFYWASQDNRDKHILKMQEVAKNLGHYPGSGIDSKLARKNTCILKYGVEHPWMKSEIRAKCESTSLDKYGFYTWEIAKSYNKKSNTSIEIKVKHVLDNLGMKYTHRYILEHNNVRREYDFYVHDINTLIEADGDYYHANPAIYFDLDEIQRFSRLNDDIKNKLAYDLNIRLLRFWESDINSDDFCDILKEKLWEK